MIENVINLLKSNNYDDKILGIIMMEKEGFTEEILKKGDSDDWHSRIRWFSELITDDEDSKCVNVVYNGKLFNVWKEGLCIIKKKYYYEVMNDELIYTDNSLNIQEIVEEWNGIFEKFNQ